MAKKNKPQKSILKILFVILALSLFLFGTVLFNKNKENADIKGLSTSGRIATTTSKTTMPELNRTAGAGEACGRSVRRMCQKNLLCAPLGLPYKTQTMGNSNVELSMSSEQVSSNEVRCLGSTEEETAGKCQPFIPYYGACVKKGVWPLPTQKITPITRPTAGGCYPPPPPCTREKCPDMQPLPPGATYCTPTPTPSTVTCQWCGSECIDVTNKRVKCTLQNVEGYICVNKNNVCVKIEGDTTPMPTPPPGCFYQNVQCIQAPCDPILTCNNSGGPESGSTSESGFNGFIQQLRNTIGL